MPGSEEEELSMMIDMMLGLSEEELMLMPPEMRQTLLQLEEDAEYDPEFPGWLLDKLEDLNDAIMEVEPVQGRDRKPAYDRRPGEMPDLCVLSVSLGTGCYRHIRVPEDILLCDLAEVILWAFEFVNDHAHAFFMDNRAWSHADSYYSPELYNPDFNPFYSGEEERTTDEFRLQDTGLRKDKKFKFIFDFGDEWTFQCKVLRTGEHVASKDQLENAEVIRSKGEPPGQYGWEDWDGFDEEDDF